MYRMSSDIGKIIKIVPYKWLICEKTNKYVKTTKKSSEIDCSRF